MKPDYEFAEEFCGKMQQALNTAIAGIRDDLLAEVRAAWHRPMAPVR